LKKPAVEHRKKIATIGTPPGTTAAVVVQEVRDAEKRQA
jgi:hypothetical protein